MTDSTGPAGAPPGGQNPPPPDPVSVSVRVGGKDIPVWPEGQRVDFIDRYVQCTIFEDWRDYHD
jgi:hypothetical protein